MLRFMDERMDAINPLVYGYSFQAVWCSFIHISFLDRVLSQGLRYFDLLGSLFYRSPCGPCGLSVIHK